MQDGKYLTFDLYNQIYAIEISCIKEIINGHGGISRVPEFPDYGKGIINLRGDIVPVIDLRIRLGYPSENNDSNLCIIVVEASEFTGSHYLGFAVDKVRAVSDFEGAGIAAAPRLSAKTSKYLTGVYKSREGIVMILNPEAVLTENMISAINQYMAENTDAEDSR